MLDGNKLKNGNNVGSYKVYEERSETCSQRTLKECYMGIVLRTLKNETIYILLVLQSFLGNIIPKRSETYSQGTFKECQKGTFSRTLKMKVFCWFLERFWRTLFGNVFKPGSMQRSQNVNQDRFKNIKNESFLLVLRTFFENVIRECSETCLQGTFR